MGEKLTIVSTVFWTLHITYTDMATEYVDSISMMCIQLGVVTFLSFLAALLLEVSEHAWHDMVVQMNSMCQDHLTDACCSSVTQHFILHVSP